MIKIQKTLNMNNKIIEEFKSDITWEEKYKKLISLGKNLPAYPDEFRDEKFKVKGCQSQVWLHAKLVSSGEVHFDADSDALLVKGLIALLLNVFNDKQPKEILETSVDFVKEIGLEQNLTPSRSNGLFAMIKQIKIYAQAFALLQANKNA